MFNQIDFSTFYLVYALYKPWKCIGINTSDMLWLLLYTIIFLHCLFSLIAISYRFGMFCILWLCRADVVAATLNRMALDPIWCWSQQHYLIPSAWNTNALPLFCYVSAFEVLIIINHLLYIILYFFYHSNVNNRL